MNLLLYPHGGSGNHGCEAIVRSTLKIAEANTVLYSNNVEEDKIYQLDKLCTIKKSNNLFQENQHFIGKHCFKIRF